MGFARQFRKIRCPGGVTNGREMVQLSGKIGQLTAKAIALHLSSDRGKFTRGQGFVPKGS
jgi:hypothetical protein